jgi:hypothetical protein
VSTIQLRRYQLAPDSMDSFLWWWRERLLPVRRQYGFEILFGLINHEANEFVWAVRHPGDKVAFDHADKAYSTSPERASAVIGLPPDLVLATHVHKVQAVAAEGLIGGKWR